MHDTNVKIKSPIITTVGIAKLISQITYAKPIFAPCTLNR